MNTRPLSPFLAFALLAIALLASPGCGGADTTPILLESPGQEAYAPGRFVLGVTVLGTPDGQRDPAFQPARYIVEADGQLRAAVGAGVTPLTFPPVTRRLDDRQIAGLWAIVERSDILRDPDPARTPSAELVRAEKGRTIAVVFASAGDIARTSRFELSPPDPDSPRIRPLIRELAKLAWIDQ